MSTVPPPPSSQVPDQAGRYGPFGGRYVPETLVYALDQLVEQYAAARADPQFQAELDELLQNYVGRPSPAVSRPPTLTEQCGGAQIWLKREDLNHTGAHKINNTLGQALLTLRMGKQRVIAETGAGQHGVATATACAHFGLDCVVYMGEEDIRRQAPNVFSMKLLGAEVRPVTSGSRTLRDAINEAMRDWMASVETTHYILGSVVGPASVSADRPRLPVGHRPRNDRSSAATGWAACPTWSSPASAAAATRPACSTRSSSTTEVELVGVEAGGRGNQPGEHASPLTYGSPACCTAASATSCRTKMARPATSIPMSAGLDYPGVGPEHSYWKETGRVTVHELPRRRGAGGIRRPGLATKASCPRWKRRTPWPRRWSWPATMRAERADRGLPLRPRRQGCRRNRPSQRCQASAECSPHHRP